MVVDTLVAMAKPGDTVELPGGGERIVFRQTEGGLLEMEATYAPRGRPPPEHYHPAQEERFECLAGTVNVRLDGQERTLAAGEKVTVPPGVAHTFWNGGETEAKVSWEVRPALRTAEMFEQLGRASSTLRALAVIARHANEFRLARPPWVLQRPLMAVARALTRA
jgi:quercetin dioxygenase-like cupin family protein